MKQYKTMDDAYVGLIITGINHELAKYDVVCIYV